MTSDERREVACRLRTEVSEGECIDYAVFRIINDVLGVNGAWGAKAARILADLIDPTCRNVSGCKDTFECSKCRCKVELITEVCNEYGEPFHVPLVPSYCPNCRARVVMGDEG